MAENSAIEWTDHTFNPWIGCTKVGPGCVNCYAEVLMDHRHHRVEWGGDRSLTADSTWALPLRWERQAQRFWEEHGRLQRVFCSSLADVFDNHRSIKLEWRQRLAKLILATPSLEWLLLTKRIGNALDMLILMFPDGVPMNVRVGATIVDQNEWDRDHRKIAQVRVACEQKPFLSCEPLLGPIVFDRADPAWHRYIGWVITGGESGRNARPTDPVWSLGIRDQCSLGRVPYLHKQNGEWAAVSTLAPEPGEAKARTQAGDIFVMSWPEGTDGFIRSGTSMRLVGKKAAGRELFGATYTEFPA